MANDAVIAEAGTLSPTIREGALRRPLAVPHTAARRRRVKRPASIARA